ncbi:MAG: iron ABC transporter permease [Bacillus sp. (in: firmicutes)]
MQESLEEQRKKFRIILVMIILSSLIVIAFILSMNTGFIQLSPLNVLKTLFGQGTANQSLILFEFRLPRIIISILVGAGLAVSGCIIQSITRSPLADPGILGINAGAGLMVVLFISFFPSREVVPVYLLPLFAFFGAALAAALIYSMSYKKYKGVSPSLLLMNGVAIAFGISAVIIILTLKFEPNQYQFVATWLAGTIWGSNWKFVLSILPWLIILFFYVFYNARVLNVLNFGKEAATGLGLPVEKSRLWLLIAAVALAGSCVAVSGGIGFIGLIGPHLASKLVGSRHQVLLPASALVGALLLITADTLGRWILQPSELPAGIVVGIIGAPYFLYLLTRTTSK